MKKYVKYLIVILCLILVDQGAKLIVANFYDSEIVKASNDDRDSDIMKVINTVHIHPVINDTEIQELKQEASEKSIDFKVLMFLNVVLSIILLIVYIFFMYVLYRVSSKIMKNKHLKLMHSIMCLNIAAWMCSAVFDKIFWGGSLDFLCLAWGNVKKVGENYRLFPKHYIYDIKDFYLYIGLILLILYIIIMMVNYLKLSKDEKKEIEKNIKNKIINIFHARNKKADT